ncbi:radical SAM family heme chaperone HemW [Clostridium vincentii]|uniref:Heme chaperone HemW n=1 Tax=Clostridium vincentii TaxID=52704 RepID=A0A2T0BJC7_9CLOT|nr:radical SAM family heme chaperone HemW [Clostridium vincentii]PRR83933.1 Oxygen-independent coproporphyrinogen-III oxidase 1 [Clostridium vincentii]
MKETALYIHIPFCKQKCFYCDFPSYAKKDGLINDYISALCKEIKERCKGYKIRSLFIGGGTPTYLDEVQLEILMNTIKELNFISNAEKSIECNPGTVNEKKFRLMKSGGINRLSFGLQTTKNDLLKSIGRIHSFEEFERNYHLARDIGFNNINIDMMFGLPKQEVNDWMSSLEEVVKLNPEHISAYGLIIEEGTIFNKLYKDDKLSLPLEEDERKMYDEGRKFLIESGYNQYEISNYAKSGKECLHNKVYWRCEEYMGVGASASSYIENKRFKNLNNLEEYINKINRNEKFTEEEHENTQKDNMEEFMFMGLRMIEGIEEDEFKNRFGVDVDSIYKNVIDNNIKRGLLIRKSGKIYLSKVGIELSNIVMSDMIL